MWNELTIKWLLYNSDTGKLVVSLIVVLLAFMSILVFIDRRPMFSLVIFFSILVYIDITRNESVSFIALSTAYSTMLELALRRCGY